jgi:hypothetical protein
MGACEQSHHPGGRAVTQLQDEHRAARILSGGTMRRQFDAWAIRYSGKVPLTGGRAFLIANHERHRFPSGTMNLLRSSAFSLRGKFSARQATLSQSIPR